MGKHRRIWDWRTLARGPLLWLAGLAAAMVLSGCGSPPGVIFDPANTVNRWPQAPDTARIAYVGELKTDMDLKPGRGAFKGLGEAIFGKEPPRGMTRPMAVCTDGQRVFVADSDGHVVHVFDLNTRKYEEWSPPKDARPFLQPVACAFDAANGRLLVSDSGEGSVVMFDRMGKYLGTMGDNWLHRPCGLLVEDKRVLVVDSAAHQIVALGLDGSHLERIGKRGSAPGEFNYPTFIAKDGQGRYYVSDSLNFRVQVLDADFKPIREIGRKGDLPGYFAQPKGLAVDDQDHLYVVDANFEAVQIFDADGALLMSFGHEGHGPGEFWLPAGAAIDASGRLWIADSFNKRVQVFERLDVQGGADGK